MIDIPETLITTYLEMSNPDDLTSPYTPVSGVDITLMQTPDVEFYRFLYRSVGYKWRWRNRLPLSDEELAMILKAEATTVYVLYEGGVPGGYVELDKQKHVTEIAYFGLREPFIGRGLGKQLLNFGVEKAWQQGAKRVWLHTCNLDGPHALTNYQKRGFKIYKVTEEPMPAEYLD